MSCLAPGPAAVFDRLAVRRHRDRAAMGRGHDDFLLNEAAKRLASRLEGMGKSFPLALDLGCRKGLMKNHLEGLCGVETLVQCDLSLAMICQAKGLRLAADEELLPFAAKTFDLIISCLGLHWVNDLPGALAQARIVLGPGGLFLASMLGGETLKELRLALAQAENSVTGRESQRVSPFSDVKMAGDLLQRAGFKSPVTDSETLTVMYREPLELMADLRAMGEANAAAARPKSFARKSIMMEAARRYHDLYSQPGGRVAATFEIITLTAWAPS